MAHSAAQEGVSIPGCDVEPGAGQWQPIETAPKDGTEVLVYVPRRLGALYAGASNPTGTQWWSRNLGDIQPSHWMPVPPAPARPDRGDGKGWA